MQLLVVILLRKKNVYLQRQDGNAKPLKYPSQSRHPHSEGIEVTGNGG